MKRGYVFGDIARGFDELDHVLNGYFPSYVTFSTGNYYDPEKYELKPRESYKKKLLKEKEDKLLSLKERKDNYERQYEEEVKALKLEIDQLKQSLSG